MPMISVVLNVTNEGIKDGLFNAQSTITFKCEYGIYLYQNLEMCMCTWYTSTTVDTSTLLKCTCYTMPTKVALQMSYPRDYSLQ